MHRLPFKPMNHIFLTILRQFVLVFFDDILIYSASWRDHLLHLEKVLSILQEHQLHVKLHKCAFGTKQIAYLGHMISSIGVSMDSDKVVVVLQWLVPSNIKQLRGFLGLTGYYRRFVKGYVALASPLHDLLKKNAFEWSEQAQSAFQDLKAALTKAPVLVLPNFSIPFELETDASGTVIGAILGQQGHPIAFFSKKLSPRLQAKSGYVREMLAITEAVAKFCHYLLEHRFVIKTDHKSLCSLMDQVLQTPEQQQWMHKLMGYDFVIEYKPGPQNSGVDALSRLDYFALSVQHCDFLNTLRAELLQDPEYSSILLAL